MIYINQLVDIKEIEVKVNYLKQQTAENIIEIGNQLIAAKELVEHGEWETWLKNKVDFSAWTARRFMKVAEEFPNRRALTDLGQTKVFKLLELPQEQRDQFIEENNVQDMTTRELNEEIKKLKREVSDYENTKPKVIEREVIKEVEVVKEVIPEDYEKYKEWWSESTSNEHFNKVKNLHDDALKEIARLESIIENSNADKEVEEYKKTLKTSALSFSMKARSFIEDVGGLVWLSDQQDDFDEIDKKIYKETVILIYGFAGQLFNSLKEE